MIDDAFITGIVITSFLPTPKIDKSADDIYIGGISTKEWTNRIECYGDCAEDAEDLRDLILALLQAYQEELKRRNI